MELDKRWAPRWRDLSDEDREREYTPSSCTGGTFQPYIDEYVEKSHAARVAAVDAGVEVQVIRYGEASSQTIDVVVPAAAQPMPLVVYIHGGYWQLLSKIDSFFGATDALANGWAYAAVDYTLAPEATLDEIVDECRTAVAALRDRSEQLGYDDEQIFVCGSSAGGHLSAMVGLGLGEGDPWRPAGVGLVSGVFELEPLIGTSINNAVGLDRDAAYRNSPMLADLRGFPPAFLAWGDNETDEFKRQSRSLRELLDQAGVSAVELEVPGHNHFNVVVDICNTSSLLGQALGELIVSVPPAS